MSTLSILLIQSRIGATIEIIALLLGAGIIGYVTAWLYYKSIYVRRIKVIESEKDELNIEIAKLYDAKSKLNISLDEKDKEVKNLNLEVKTLRALHKEAVHETEKMILKNKRNEQLLNEKNEAQTHIVQSKHLLDYKSFGTATETEKDDLKMISGIGPYIEERLQALDIFTFRQISNFTEQDTETINNAIIYI